MIKSLGWYREEGYQLAREYSFLVFNHKNDGSPFLERMRELAERFTQDSFLYKKLGEKEQACLFDIRNCETTSIGFINFKGVDPSEDHSMIGHHAFVFSPAKD